MCIISLTLTLVKNFLLTYFHLFHRSAPAPASTGLFGSTSAPATGGLFGSTSAPATGGGLFGSTPAPATGGLFGAPAPAPGTSETIKCQSISIMIPSQSYTYLLLFFHQHQAVCSAQHHQCSSNNNCNRGNISQATPRMLNYQNTPNEQLIRSTN